MGDWPSGIVENRITTYGGDATTSFGTAVPSSATANTKGSYVQITSATDHDADGFSVTFAVSDWSDYLVDIAIGGSGSEIVLIANLPVCLRNVYGEGIYFPIAIPSGTRIAMRCQSVITGAQNLRATITIVKGGFHSVVGLGRATNYGVNTGTSGGISIDPGGSANTKGAYSQITASTTNRIKYLMLCLGGQNNSARTACGWLIDIAIGGAGSEVVIIGNVFSASNTGNFSLMSGVLCFPVNIPAGTRLAVRAQCSITDATDRKFDAVIMGVD